MASRFQTLPLQQPAVQTAYIPPGKYTAIDESVYKSVKRYPEEQISYGTGVATGFKGINRGWSGFLNITNPENPNPIVNYGSYIYQQRTGYQGHQSNSMNRLYL